MFAKPSTTDIEKKAAAQNAASFTKLLPFYFPNMAITRKMHILGFVIAPLIENDESDNICYKYLRIEQLSKAVKSSCPCFWHMRIVCTKTNKAYLGPLASPK